MLLLIRNGQKGMMARMPHKVLVDGRPVVLMKGKELMLSIPAGSYAITIQSLLPFISATICIAGSADSRIRLTFSDRERWWDILFAADLLVSMAMLFVTLSASCKLLYHILSDGFFAIWLIHEWRIRKKYFVLKAETLPLG